LHQITIDKPLDGFKNTIKKEISMAKFNPVIKVSKRKTVNLAGGEAYTLSSEMELYTAAVTGMLSNKYYETANQTLERIQENISKVDPLYVAKLAVYCREQANLRSIPLVLVVELLKALDGKELSLPHKQAIGRAITRVIARADEICEILSYYKLANPDSVKEPGKGAVTIPAILKKAVARAFLKFDEYQFSKYNRNGEHMNLKNAARLTHPLEIADEKQRKIIEKIIRGELEIADTWETRQSKAGQKAENEEAKTELMAENWKELILTKKLGYMALLRNLRNILENPKTEKEIIEAVLTRIADKDEVATSKQWPYRFFSAYMMLNESNVDKFLLERVKDALETAATFSAANIPGFGPETNVAIFGDTSGSMSSLISEKSVVMRHDVAMLMARTLKSYCKTAIMGIFGERFAWLNIKGQKPLEGTLEDRALNGRVGHSTNAYLCIKELIAKKACADKIFIFTDMQVYGVDSLAKLWDIYRKDINPKARLYLVDLAGYGTTPVDIKSGLNVAIISGWSEKVFTFIDKLEHGEEMLSDIHAIEL
jgi:hypothetical protein